MNEAVTTVARHTVSKLAAKAPRGSLISSQRERRRGVQAGKMSDSEEETAEQQNEEEETVQQQNENDDTIYVDADQELFEDILNVTDYEDNATNVRRGTIASARFNILSTMVGGGSLSLPLAFQKTGNCLMAPVLLIGTALITEFCFRILLQSIRTLSPVHATRPGKDSFESIAEAAFGGKALVACTVLVTLMCFFGIVGYAVLLRDMLEPVTDVFFSTTHRNNSSSPALHDNIIMLTVVVCVTPLCTLQTLTALKKFGAASMGSVLILGACILYRSVQCTAGWLPHTNTTLNAFAWFPDNWKDVLDVLPLFISCYVCHYNIPSVHNELRDASGARVRWWLRSTVAGSTLFYLTLGVAGSSYAPCAADDVIHGNILLNFPEDDPLLLVGRLCLALTITLAFPMLTIPARDILIRAAVNWKKSADGDVGAETVENNTLQEPLLPNDSLEEQTPVDVDEDDEEQPDDILTVQEPDESATVDAEASASKPATLGVRLLSAVSIFWTGAVVASCVSSIDVVWDLLGSSLSILLSHLIPCGCYLVISKNEGHRNTLSVVIAWVLIFFFTPLMFVSTANAVYNTFS